MKKLQIENGPERFRERCEAVFQKYEAGSSTADELHAIVLLLPNEFATLTLAGLIERHQLGGIGVMVCNNESHRERERKIAINGDVEVVQPDAGELA